MKFITFAIFVTLATSACSRKKISTNHDQQRPVREVYKETPVTSTYPVENPLAGYLRSAGFKANGHVSQIGVPSEEIGFYFKPLTNGIITAITVKIPAVRSDLEVTIWDKEEVEKLVDKEVNVNVADKQFTFAIKPLKVFKNREYAISMNSGSFYQDYKSAGVSYPIKVGNILVTNYCYNDGVQKKFPIRTNVNRYNGNISFNFQKADFVNEQMKDAIR
jgi:hypothetical protein